MWHTENPDLENGGQYVFCLLCIPAKLLQAENAQVLRIWARPGNCLLVAVYFGLAVTKRCECSTCRDVRNHRLSLPGQSALLERHT